MSVLNIHRKAWCWSWSSNILVTWCEKLTHWKSPWCWERLKEGGEQDYREWDVGWDHWFDRHEFEQAPGVGDGQGSLACCSPWGRKDSDTTERQNWTMFLIFWLLSVAFAAIYMPTNTAREFPLLHVIASIYFWSFYDSYCNRCKMITQ